MLVLHEGCGVDDPVLRRRRLYALLREAIGGELEVSVIDMEFERFLKPKEIDALLLNIYWDAAVVYDETGLLQGFLRDVKEKIVKSGLRRVKDGRAYRWILPRPLREIKIL